MALAVIVFDEFLQFGCWTADPTSHPEELQCEGLNGFFAAFRITDVKLESGNSFVFHPTFIFPTLDKSFPQWADPGLYPNPEHFARIVLKSGSTFKGSGQGPMLIVRDVFRSDQQPVQAGNPTQLSYKASPGDEVVFEPIGTVPILAVNVADPSMVS